jgi:esterase/lipase superfamily enzyme
MLLSWAFNSRKRDLMPIKRRFKIIGGILLLAVVAVAVLFQNSTQSALVLAEALQFRRMLVTRQDDGAFRFFYVTNRAVEDQSAPVEDRFSNERSEKLSFGFFDTSIEPSLGIGMLINPTDWFQNEEIQLDQVKSLQEDAMISELRRQVEASSFRSLLINVNGFRERFPSALRKTAFLAHVLDIDTPMLVFDWPGDQGNGPRRYLRAQTIARESGVELATTIDRVVRDVQPDRLWIVANSMGAEVVVSAFSELYKQKEMADSETEIEHVILTAPDVSHQEFGSHFRRKILALSENLTVYVSSNDRALLMSRVINRGRRLGESTVDPSNPDQWEEAASAFELVTPGSSRVTLIDITPVNRTRNFHNFSLETPEFFDDLFLRISNEETPTSRLRYKVTTASGAEYWVLTKGR